MKHVIAQSRDAKLCMVAVFGIIFVVEIEQKQALKRKSFN